MIIKLTGRPSLEMQAKHEAYVLDIAFKEFLAHGFKGTSLDAIAKRAGISRVTLYRRYHGKVGLFLAVGAHAVERLKFNLDHVETSGRSPREVLEEFMLTAYDAATTRETLAILRMAVGERHAFPDLAATTRRNRTEFLRPVGAYLDELAARGVISLDMPGADAAEKLMDLCLSLYVVLLEGPLKTANERRKAVQQAVGFFLKASGYTAIAKTPRTSATSRKSRTR